MRDVVVGARGLVVRVSNESWSFTMFTRELEGGKKPGSQSPIRRDDNNLGADTT